MNENVMNEEKRILLIDDEERFCQVMGNLLSKEGYEVESVNGGREGIDIIKERSFDLVITDLMMPEVDGLEVLKHIQDQEYDTLVIVITGYATLESAIRAIRKGAFDYITKPFDIELMKITIERAFEKIQMQRALQDYSSNLEREVERRTDELRRTQNRLIQTERLAAIGELAASIAHEIRNPLVSIGGFARVLYKNSGDEKKVEKYSHIIVDEVDRLEKILENILDYSKKTELDLKPMDFNILVEKTILLFDTELSHHKIKLKVDLDYDLSEVDIDEIQMKQVLMNFFKNAIHAMPEGGILAIRSYASGNNVALDISDTGMGIPRENLKKLFRPFFSTRSHGTGLGLGICQKVVTDHGGTIEVQSDVGKGTVFSIILPASQDPGLSSPPS